MKLRMFVSLGMAGGLALAGCAEPRIVPVAPPGVEMRRVAPPTAGSGAEALGETGSASAAAAQAKVVSTLVSEPTPLGQTKKTSSGLAYETLKEGTGPAAKPGQTVKVNYVGKLTDGTKFDASADHGGPSEFPIGVGRVIKGWDEGVPGMKMGEKRRLIIPSELAYGSRGSGSAVPPNSALVFEIDMIEAK